VLLHERVQLARLAFAFRARFAAGRGDIERQERERLVVKQGTVIERRAVGRHQRSEESVGPLIARNEVVERMLDEAGRVAAPAKRRRHGEGICLAWIDARAPRFGERLAVLCEPLVKSTTRVDAFVDHSG
jgi:hypothetical protein